MAMRRKGAPYLVAFCLISTIEILLVSGITYGWASMLGVFQKEGFYESLCTPLRSQDNSSSSRGLPRHTNSSLHRVVRAAASVDGATSEQGCGAQSARLNLVFTISVFSLCGVTFLIGGFVDKYGPRAARLVGCVIYTASGIGLAFAHGGISDVLFPVFVGFCVGGAFISLAIYQASSVIFDRVKAIVLCIQHGTFDSSAVILLIFKVAYEGGFSLQQISLTYTIICLVLVLPMTFLLIPSNEEVHSIGQQVPPEARQSLYSLKYIGSKLANYNVEILSGNVSNTNGKQRILERMSLSLEHNEEINIKFSDAKGERDEDALMPNVEIETLKKLLPSTESMWEIIKTPLYLTDLWFLSVIQLRLWFFIGAFRAKMKILTNNNEDEMNYYSSVFGYAQLCGVAVAPFIGLVFDKSLVFIKSNKSKPPVSKEVSTLKRIQESVLPFVITLLLAIIFSALTLIDSKDVIIPSCILHVIVRGFVYSDHAAFIGIAFAPHFFGRLYGLGIFLAGVFGLLQYALFVFMEDHLNGQPFWLDVGLLISIVTAAIQPVYVACFCRRRFKQVPRVSYASKR